MGKQRHKSDKKEVGRLTIDEYDRKYSCIGKISVLICVPVLYISLFYVKLYITISETCLKCLLITAHMFHLDYYILTTFSLSTI